MLNKFNTLYIAFVIENLAIRIVKIVSKHFIFIIIITSIYIIKILI